jgi:protein FRA10AC1
MSNILPSDLQSLKEYHQFVRDDEFDANHGDEDWKVRLARRYYDKLYKEFAIIDLSRYKENMIGLRWRTEAEVVSGKGQESCAAKKCLSTDQLSIFELPFAYSEQNEEKLELVKVTLCGSCTKKLNYYQKMEAKRENRKQALTSQAIESLHTPKLAKSKGKEKHESKKSQKNKDRNSSSSSSSSNSSSSGSSEFDSSSDDSDGERDNDRRDAGDMSTSKVSSQLPANDTKKSKKRKHHNTDRSHGKMKKLKHRH